MFDVFIKNLLNVCSQMERQISELNSQVSEIESVAASVASLQGLGDIRRVLLKEKEKVENERDALKRLLLALNNIINSYVRTENRIFDNCEQSGNKFSYIETGVVQMGQGSRFIK